MADDLLELFSKPPPSTIKPTNVVDMFAGPPPPVAPSASPITDDPFERAAARTQRSVTKGAPRPQEAALLREPDIDYNTGAPLNARVGLSRMSNPNEAQLYLQQSFGEGNFGQDRYGNWWVNQGGKKTAVFPSNASFTGLGKNLVSGLAASSPATAGAIGGAAIGGAVAPGVGAIPGAMVGAVAGKGYDELVKWLQGTFAKTPAETVGELSTEGALAGAFQGAGPLMARGKELLRAGAQRWMGVTPASRQMGAELAEAGARPPIGAVAPEASAMEYKRNLRNVLAGDPAEAARLGYIDQRMRNILGQEGIPEPQLETMMREIYDRSARISAQEAGQSMTGRAAAINRELLVEAQATRQQAERQLRAVDRVINRAASAPTSLGTDVAEAIRGERRAFSQQMKDIYSAVDKLTSGPIVRTEGIADAARGLVDIMPPQAVPPIIRQWATEGAPAALTFEQAHALRTTLREMSEMIDVTPTGQKVGNVSRMAGMVDQAIRASEGGLGQQQAQLLRQADRIYGQGIARFNDATINKLVKDVRAGLPPEPGYVAKTVMNTDRINTAREVFRMLPQGTRDGVIQADLRNLIDDVSTLRPDGTRMMDGKVLLDALNARSSLMQATYPQSTGGAAVLRALRTYADDLAAFDGKLDITQIRNPTQITDLLQRAAGAARAADEFARTNPLGALASGTPQQVDRAAAFIAAPGKTETTLQAARTLGANSAEWASVRRYALQNLFAKAVVETPSLGKTLSGSSVDKALGAFTPAQQRVLFPGGLADDLRILAKEVRFLFPQNPNDFGASLAAASIKSGIPFNLWADYKYARAIVSGWLADHPKVIRFLAQEVKRDPQTARTTMSVMRQWIIDGMLAGPGSGPPEKPAPNKIPDRAPRTLPAAFEPEKPAYGGPQE